MTEITQCFVFSAVCSLKQKEEHSYTAVHGEMMWLRLTATVYSHLGSFFFSKTDVFSSFSRNPVRLYLLRFHFLQLNWIWADQQLKNTDLKSLSGSENRATVSSEEILCPFLISTRQLLQNQLPEASGCFAYFPVLALTQYRKNRKLCTTITQSLHLISKCSLLSARVGWSHRDVLA